MLLHDRVTIVVVEPAYDNWGQPIPGGVRTEHVIPAEVQPINSDVSLERHSSAEIVTTRFRITTTPTDLEIEPATEVLWNNYVLRTEGEIEPHSLRGRVHHIEFIARYHSLR